MPLTIATDILFRDDPPPDRLHHSVADAFRVPPEQVAVAEAAGNDPIPDDAQIILLHRSRTMPGDFPSWYGLTVDADLVERIDPALNTVARHLGTVALSDADDEQDMTIHLPDGSGHVVRLMQGNDNAFRMTPEIHRLIERATRRSPGADDDLGGPVATSTRGRKAIAS